MNLNYVDPTHHVITCHMNDESLTLYISLLKKRKYFLFPRDRISTYLLLPEELSYNINRNVPNSDTLTLTLDKKIV